MLESGLTAMASLESDQLQTWVDLLNRAAPESAADTVAGPSSGNTGLRVSMSTPVPHGARTASRLDRGGSDAAAMRSQVVSLLKQKQELLQRVRD